MHVSKELFWSAPYPGCQLMGAVFGYTSVAGQDLYGAISEAVLLDNKTMARVEKTTLIRSQDNGDHWEEVEWFPAVNDTLDGTWVNQLTCGFLDARKDIFLRFYIQRFVCDGKYFGSDAVDLRRNFRQCYQISRNGGQTWENEKFLLQKGSEYDPIHWAKGIHYGRNGGGMINCPYQLDNGCILLPFQMRPWDESRKQIDGCMRAGALIGS